MMRYIKPSDFKSVREFQAYYQKIEQDIHTLLTTDGSANSAKELNDKLSQALNAAMSYLSKKNQEFTQKELATAFQEGRQSVKEEPKLSVKVAAEILEKQGYKYAKNGLSRDTYIELQNAILVAGKGLKSRVNSIIGDLRKSGKDTVYNVQQAILNDLQKNGLLNVEYSNGAKQPLHAYAAMAARSARIESTNIGAIGRALQAGTDYVKMTTMPQCCKLCAAYQDKVYCISGKDKRFPALFKTVLRSGYALPHPNCRHEFIPWFIEMESPADVAKAIKDSKIQYDSKGNLVDVRFQKDIELYASWQAGNRQLNRELLEFQRMKEHYAGRESDMPYKSLGSFRKARRADNLSPAFKAWRYQKMDTNTLNRWKSIKDFRNCPKTVEDLQEIKYNKSSQWELLKRERKTISDINGKNWTDSFHNKAVDTYYKFRKKGVEFTDHGVARFLARLNEDEFWQIHNKPFNYVQEDGRLVKYYNDKAIIYLPNTKEIVSCYVKQKKAKGDWNEIENKTDT